METLSSFTVCFIRHHPPVDLTSTILYFPSPILSSFQPHLLPPSTTEELGLMSITGWPPELPSTKMQIPITFFWFELCTSGNSETPGEMMIIGASKMQKKRTEPLPRSQHYSYILKPPLSGVLMRECLGIRSGCLPEEGNELQVKQFQHRQRFQFEDKWISTIRK